MEKRERLYITDHIIKYIILLPVIPQKAEQEGREFKMKGEAWRETDFSDMVSALEVTLGLEFGIQYLLENRRQGLKVEL